MAWQFATTKPATTGGGGGGGSETLFHRFNAPQTAAGPYTVTIPHSTVIANSLVVNLEEKLLLQGTDWTLAGTTLTINSTDNPADYTDGVFNIQIQYAYT